MLLCNVVSAAANSPRTAVSAAALSTISVARLVALSACAVVLAETSPVNVLSAPSKAVTISVNESSTAASVLLIMLAIAAALTPSAA